LIALSFLDLEGRWWSSSRPAGFSTTSSSGRCSEGDRGQGLVRRRGLPGGQGEGGKYLLLPPD
jgi:hypothetical protein